MEILNLWRPCNLISDLFVDESPEFLANTGHESLELAIQLRRIHKTFKPSYLQSLKLLCVF